MQLIVWKRNSLISRITFWFFRKRRAEKVPEFFYFNHAEVTQYNSHYRSISFNVNNEKKAKKDIFFLDQTGSLTHFIPPHCYFKVWLKHYLIELIKVEKRPWFLINGDTDLLRKMIFYGKARKALQRGEVAFYLYEPIFYRSERSGRIPAFFSKDELVTIPEIAWIEEFCDNNGIKSPVVYVCDYMLGDYMRFHNLHQKVVVKTWDVFIADLSRSLKKREIEYQPEFQISGYPFSTSPAKKFLCLNYRYEGFREAIVGYFYGAQIEKQCHLSFYHLHCPERFRADFPFDYELLKQRLTIDEGIRRLQPDLPLILDAKSPRVIDLSESFPHPDADGVSNLRNEVEIYKWYNDSFVVIANETRFGHYCGEISEKTLHAIAYMRPFIVVGGPYMLRYLKELGFKTFEDLWDESYDLIEDHQSRLEKIFDLIDEVSSYEMERCHEILVKIQDRLEFNRNHLLNNLMNDMHKNLQMSMETE